MQDLSLLEALAHALLAGPPTEDSLFDRCSQILGRRWRWIRPLTERYAKKFRGTRPRRRQVVHFLRNDRALQRALARHSEKVSIVRPATQPQMLPVSSATWWNLPVIETPGDLANGLGLTPGELRWFADLKALGYKNREPRLRNYSYRVLSKCFGSVRLIEAPKPCLKDLQLQIMRWILEKIPSHPAVHGFVKKRSIKTFVAPHLGRAVVLRMDVRDFFPTFGGSRIQNLFRTIGYPEAVADLMGGICTNATPQDVWNEESLEANRELLRELRHMYARPHLPQGAPTSPALANLSFYRLDCRLTGLAHSAGAAYTRYADDLAFSGDDQFAKRAHGFSQHVASLLLEEGFRIHHRKTRVMRQGVRQHLVGLVINQRTNIHRAEFDRLEAIVTNCARFGPESQNRERRPHFREYLEGRVSFLEMVNPAKGQRIRRILHGVRWEC